jgi:hypothetical protein
MGDPEMNDREAAPESRRDWTLEILIVTMSTLEVLFLYLVLTFESPLWPFARQATETIGGTITLVLLILLFPVCLVVAGVWFLLGKLTR